MKITYSLTLLVSAFMLTSPFTLHAQTLGKPFTLPDGKYSFECYGMTVLSNGKGKATKLKHIDAYQLGQRTVSTTDGVVTETIEPRGAKGEVGPSATQTTITKDLGNAQFTQEIEIKSPNGTSKMTINVRSIQNITQLSSIIVDGKKGDLTGKEFTWFKTPDGRIVTQDFLLASLASGGGAAHNHAVCVYTPEK